MKVIDLLNKIANGEEVPEKIFYAEQYWINKYPNDYEGLGYGGCLLNNVCLNNLNDEVEILEEPKGIPEKLEIVNDGNTITLFGKEENEWTILDNVEVIMCNKINEIIDFLKSKGE